MTEPAPTAVTTAVTRGISVAGRPVGDALVVTRGDGSLGWAGPPVVAEGSQVVLTAGDRRVEGRARVVRSGAAYEEVCGRTREAAGWRGRWARRPDAVVLVVETVEDEDADEDVDGQANSASAR